MTAAKQTLTFEKALQKLEQIVAEIEEGKVSLEVSIGKYAEGTELITQCRAILDEAEKKIQLLARGQTPDGQETLQPDGELPDEGDQEA